MKKTSRKLITILFLSTFFLNVLLSNNLIKINQEDTTLRSEKVLENPPISADISGNELYAEQISATISNNESLIRQSMITNDTNIMEEIDLNDPAFYRASFYLSMSNGIESPFTPHPVSSSWISQLGAANYPIYGFLYYEPSTNYELIQIRKNRAMDILKDIFEIDLIITNPDENETKGFFYPFYGSYPKTDVVLDIALANVPNDGYWKAFDRDRILNTDYLQNQYFSLSILYLRSFEAITQGLGNYKLEDLGIIANLGFLNITDQLSNVGQSLENSPIMGLLPGITGDTGAGTEDIMSLFNSLAIDKMLSSTLTNVVLTTIEYEGKESGIRKNNNGSYTFELFNAIGYSGSVLSASEKSYNSLLGVLLSGIDISFISAEVIDTNPQNFYLSDAKLSQLEMLIFLVGINFDIEAIKAYRFTVGWQNQEFVSKMAIGVENYQDTANLINIVSSLGFIGFPLLFGALIEPINGFEITYENSQYEPYLSISREIIGSPTNIVNNNLIYNITVKNEGENPVYGTKISLAALNITNDPNSNMLMQSIGYNVPRNELIDLLNQFDYDTSDIFIDKGTRLFTIDSFGQGIPDYIYPELTTFTNINAIAPFSPIVSTAIIEHPLEFLDLFGVNAILYSQLFNSSASIFNPSNWVLAPGESFSYNTTNTNLTFTNAYTAFSRFNVSSTPGISPIISLGTETTQTDINVTNIDNSQYWGVKSENLGNAEFLQTYFVFENSSNLNFGSNTLDAINITIKYQTLNQLSSYKIELFNYSSQEFVNIPTNYFTFSTTQMNLQISNRQMKIENFVDAQTNYSIIVRITLSNSNSFNWNIRFIQLGFLDRVLSTRTLQPATITYSSAIGRNIYQSSSNTVILSNDEMSLIVGTANINSISSYCGEPNQYNLTITNRGTQPAYNITISLKQPGIIIDPIINSTYIQDNKEYWKINAGSFLIDQGILNVIIPYLAPNQTISNINFRFFTPNSREISSATISWDDYRDRTINASDFITKSNTLYVSAPILYGSSVNNKPFVHQIEMGYVSPNPTNPPHIGDSFNGVLQIKNVGLSTIKGYSPNFAYNVSGFEFNLTQRYTISSLSSLQNQTVSINYTKKDFTGYMLPAIRNGYGYEEKFTQIKTMDPLILGTFDLVIDKSINTLDEQAPRKITVTIRVENRGTLEVGNFCINDVFAYDAKGFTLVTGKMLQPVSLLEAGESIEFSYTLILKDKGNYIMNPAEIQYFFIQKQLILSEQYEFKVREPYWLLTMRVYGPIIIGALMILGVYKLKMQYNQEDYEFERREALLFGQNLRDISWNKKNIVEFLDESIELENKSEGDES